MRAVVACLLLVALTLAGCTAKDKDKDSEIVADDTSATGSTSASSTTGSPGAATPTGTSSVSSSTSTAPAPEDNSAPTGTISAVINGTKVAFSLNGTDADGDALNWTLNFGDNSTDAAGASLPALVNHTYAVGNYSAVFSLADGTTHAEYNVTLAIAAIVSGGPTSLAFSGDVVAPCPHCTVVIGEAMAFEDEAGAGPPVTPIPSASWAAGEQGFDAIWTALPVTLVGKTFTATSTGLGGDVAVVFMTSCEASSAKALEMSDNDASETGTVPEGTACIVLWSFDAPMATLALVVGD